MNFGVNVFIRSVAWIAGVGAVCAVILGYDMLPAEIPITRWTVAPKSLFLALRVPLINLMTIGLIELLSPALHRAKQFDRADTAVALLLLTAAAKSVLEAAGMLLPHVPSAWTLIPLIALLVVGLGTAAYLSREFLPPQRWRQLQMTRLETAGALTLIAGIVALNLPLILRR